MGIKEMKDKVAEKRYSEGSEENKDDNDEEEKKEDVKREELLG